MRGEREERGARWTPARACGLRKEGSWASRERARPQRGVLGRHREREKGPGLGLVWVWACFSISSSLLFLIQTKFEFKYKFESKPHSNKNMHQHECNTKIKPMTNFKSLRNKIELNALLNTINLRNLNKTN